MKKRTIALILGLMVIFSLAVPTVAEYRNGLYVLDEKEYLKETQLRSYQSQAKALSDELNMDILYVQTYEKDLQKDAQTLNMGSRPNQIMLLDNDGTCDVALFGTACALTQEHVQQLRNAYIVMPTYSEAVSAYLEMAEEIVTDLNASGVFEQYDQTTQTSSRLVEQGNLLDDADKENILLLLNDVSERLQLDVVVVTVNGLSDKPAMEYAKTMFHDNGYGFGDQKDGVLLLIDFEKGAWCLYSNGSGSVVSTVEGQAYFSDYVEPELQAGNYENGILAFAQMFDVLESQGQNAEPQNATQPKESFPFKKYLLGSLLIGAITASGIVLSMKRKLKIGTKIALVTGKLKLSDRKDIPLYTTTTSRTKSKSAGGTSK